MARYVRSTPQQGAMYQRLTTLIAGSYAGLGPQNVSSASYSPMIGRPFQKPLSGSTVNTTTVAGQPYR